MVSLIRMDMFVKSKSFIAYFIQIYNPPYLKRTRSINASGEPDSNTSPGISPSAVIPGLTRDPQNLANIEEIAGQSPQ